MITIFDMLTGTTAQATATTRTTTGTGNFITSRSSINNGVQLTPQFSWMATVSGTGAVTATVLIQAAIDPAGALGVVTLATITLSGTTSANDGAALMAPWPYVRYSVTALTGTGAAVSVLQAVGN